MDEACAKGSDDARMGSEAMVECGDMREKGESTEDG